MKKNIDPFEGAFDELNDICDKYGMEDEQIYTFLLRALISAYLAGEDRPNMSSFMKNVEEFYTSSEERANLLGLI